MIFCRRLRLLPGIVQRPAVGLCVLFALLQLTLCLGQLLPHRTPPLSGLVQRPPAGRTAAASPVGGGGHSNGLLRPQGLRLVRRALSRCRPAACASAKQARPAPSPVPPSSRSISADTRQLSVDLSLQILPPLVLRARSAPAPAGAETRCCAPQRSAAPRWPQSSSPAADSSLGHLTAQRARPPRRSAASPR